MDRDTWSWCWQPIDSRERNTSNCTKNSRGTGDVESIIWEGRTFFSLCVCVGGGGVDEEGGGGNHWATPKQMKVQKDI